jgi:hypothetical protein
MPKYRVQFEWEYQDPETNEKPVKFEVKTISADSKMDAVNEYMKVVHENYQVTWCQFTAIDECHDTPEDSYRFFLEEIKKHDITPYEAIPYEIWVQLYSCAELMFEKLNLQSVDIKA